jgi:pilus assembly protein CpaC
MRGARGPAKLAALVVYIIVILVATPQAQQSASFSGSAGSVSPGPAASAPDATTIELLVGRSTILNVGSPIARVSLTVPDIADAMVTTPQQLLIHGKQAGTISLFVWDKAGGIKTYEVSVHRDLKELAEHMRQLFPGEPITVAGSGKDVVISGTVSSKYVIDKAADLASGYVEKKENVVNLLKQQEGVASNQVMLRVRFAEVSRSAMQELGAAYIVNGYKTDWFGRATTQQFPAPDFDSKTPGGLVFSDFLNLFVFNSKQGLGAVIRALQNKGLFQSLAEPNLISLNGKEASFLAGGEYPYPVAQPSTSGNTVTIMFKEFGIRLTFTPTVLGNDLIDLKVRPEVSTLDFSNAITLDGFRLPALSTRRTETEVELADGQTFAIAGLMNNTVNSSMQKIPGIGDIPVLGYLFRSRAYQKNQTELVVMITPQIIRRGSTGVSEGLPSPVEQYMGKPEKTYQNPSPYHGSPRYPANINKSAEHPPATGSAAAAPAPQPAPAANAPASAPMTTTSPSAAVPPASGAGVTYVPAPTTANTAPASSAPATLAPAASAPAAATSAPAEAAPAPAPRKMTKQEKKAAEAAARQQSEEDKARARAEEWKRAAEEHQKAEEARKAQEDGARQAKVDQERAKREAEVARKNAEVDRKKTEEQKKREKALADAADRLRQAQAAYEAELQKTGSKGGANDKSKGQDKDKDKK